MPTEPNPPFIEYLPAVFRQDEVAGRNFLRDFLGAFESVFKELQQQLDAIPDLFALLVPRVLPGPVNQGDDLLDLDLAAGLYVGDVLHLQDPDPTRVEFAVVRIAAPLGGRRVALKQALLFNHAAGTPVGVVRAPVSRTVLTNQAAEPLQSVLGVENLAVLEAEVGDVLLVGEDEAVEAGEVRAVLTDQRQVKVAPLLQNAYPPGTPVRRARRTFSTMPPPAFQDHPVERDRFFLKWLAGWIGLRLRPDLLRPLGLTDADWEQFQFDWNRRFIQEIIPLVPWRGTRIGLELFLNAFLRGEVTAATVADHPDPIQVGLVSTVGVDTYICGAPQHLFWVGYTPTTEVTNNNDVPALEQALRSIIAQEKPAHTTFELGDPTEAI